MTDLQQRFTALRTSGIGVEALAAHTTLSDSTIHNWLAGRQNETPRLRRELTPLLERIERGEISPYAPPAGSVTIADVGAARTIRTGAVRKQGRHYDIAITRKIGVALDYCWTHSTLGCITADFGSGKTHAIDAWRRAHRNIECVVVEFVEMNAGNRCAFIHELADELGVQVRAGGTVAANRVFRAIVDHLRAHPVLLIFDQCEGARVGVLQVVRQIWDATESYGVGMLLLGAHGLRDKLLTSRSHELGALTSRIEPWDALGSVARGEMEQILQHEGITDIDQAATDLLWSGVQSRQGGMRLLMKVARMIAAKHAGKPVREKTIAGILGFLRGLRIRGEAE